MALNPFDPETQEAAFMAWVEQLSAGVKANAQQMVEDGLHVRGMCSDRLPEKLVAWLDFAMEMGAVAMALELERLGRVKED